ncbi:MAG: lipid-A-disaccharide synthase N-terminal domain-containing protein [Lysobacter sp.]|nr:lipid-A-disaccharide synthase N-terminal domain-containing protein [Lysobacter sp.]
MSQATTWIVIGFVGQALFSARFLLQWLASERARRSVIPTAFWYFSLGGSMVLLAYAIHRADPVFIVGQATGLAIYLRNLYLIRIAAPGGGAEA